MNNLALVGAWAKSMICPVKKRIEVNAQYGTLAERFAPARIPGPLDDVPSTLVYMRKQIAHELQLRVPDHDACRRCKMPWPFVRPHAVSFSRRESVCSREHKTILVLCEDCWVELDTFDRLQYYESEVLKVGTEWTADDWKLIATEVRSHY